MVDQTSVALNRKVFNKVALSLGPKGSGTMNGAAKELLDEMSKIQTCPEEYAKYPPSFRRLVRRGVMRALNLSVLPNDPDTIRGIKTIVMDAQEMAPSEDARGRVLRFAQYISSTPTEHLARR